MIHIGDQRGTRSVTIRQNYDNNTIITKNDVANGCTIRFDNQQTLFQFHAIHKLSLQHEFEDHKKLTIFTTLPSFIPVMARLLENKIRHGLTAFKDGCLRIKSDERLWVKTNDYDNLTTD
uniref:Uncharacterized protein n=1 Tax=Romanomermis culicivorax TaxID=13658 RepID=A0A915HLT9_ROMCU